MVDEFGTEESFGCELLFFRVTRVVAEGDGWIAQTSSHTKKTQKETSIRVCEIMEHSWQKRIAEDYIGLSAQRRNGSRARVRGQLAYDLADGSTENRGERGGWNKHTLAWIVCGVVENDAIAAARTMGCGGPGTMTDEVFKWPWKRCAADGFGGD